MIPPTSNRWKRHADWDESSLRLDKFAHFRATTRFLMFWTPPSLNPTPEEIEF
jgi:hypothetical protein